MGADNSPLVAAEAPRKSRSRAVVAWDKRVSSELYKAYARSTLPHQILILLEISGHGVPWTLIPPILVACNPAASPARLAVIANLTLASAIDLVRLLLVYSLQ
jgi:hypothetical protein